MMLASIFNTTLCRISVGLLTLVCAIAPEVVAQDDLSSRLDGFLREGKLRDAEEYFGAAVRKSELDHGARTRRNGSHLAREKAHSLLA